MDTAATVVSLLLAAFMLVSATGKLTRMEPVVESLTAAGVQPSMFPILAAIQVVGAVGLVVGVFVTGIGIAAAIGFVLYFIGACVFHVRAGDAQGMAVPAGLAVLAAVVAGLLAAA